MPYKYVLSFCPYIWLNLILGFRILSLSFEFLVQRSPAKLGLVVLTYPYKCLVFETNSYESLSDPVPVLLFIRFYLVEQIFYKKNSDWIVQKISYFLLLKI